MKKQILLSSAIATSILIAPLASRVILIQARPSKIVITILMVPKGNISLLHKVTEFTTLSGLLSFYDTRNNSLKYTQSKIEYLFSNVSVVWQVLLQLSSDSTLLTISATK